MTTTTAALHATVSRTALEANLARLREMGHDGPPELSADAWGHRADFVAEVAGAPREGPTLDGNLLFGLTAPYVPVMTLRSTVLSTKLLRAGEGVSYGYIHRATQDTIVGLVAGGYAQGVVRALGSRTDILVDGVARPIVGRVAMDVCVVDLGGADVAAGTEVEFFGVGNPLANWVDATGMRPGELVTAVGLRVPVEVVA